MAMTRVVVQGHTLNRRTAKMFSLACKRLGFTPHIYQGSYNNTVSQSAGTHAGGGAIDVSASREPAKVVRVLREVGFAAWHRVPSQGPWIEHIHAIAIGDPELSPAARDQVHQYYNGQNGLASRGRDDGPRLHPIPTWPIKLPTLVYLNAWNQFRPSNKKPRRNVRSVKRIQNLINKRHGRHLAVDGNAGPVTRKAFKRYYGDFNRKNLKKLVAGYFRVI